MYPKPPAFRRRLRPAPIATCYYFPSPIGMSNAVPSKYLQQDIPGQYIKYQVLAAYLDSKPKEIGKSWRVQVMISPSW